MSLECLTASVSDFRSKGITNSSYKFRITLSLPDTYRYLTQDLLNRTFSNKCLANQSENIMQFTIFLATLLVAVLCIYHVQSLGLTGKVNRRFVDSVLEVDGVDSVKRDVGAEMAGQMLQLIERALGISDTEDVVIQKRHGGGYRYGNGGGWGGGGGTVVVPVAVQGGGGFPKSSSG